MVKIDFLQKVLNGLVSEKNYFTFLHFQRGLGGPDHKVEFSNVFAGWHQSQSFTPGARYLRVKNSRINKILCLFIIYLFVNPTVKGTWKDQKVQKNLGPLRNTAYCLHTTSCLVIDSELVVCGYLMTWSCTRAGSWFMWPIQIDQATIFEKLFLIFCIYH